MAAEQPDVIPPPNDPFGQHGVEYCLQICGFTQPAQRNGWIDEGMATMQTYVHLGQKRYMR